MKYWLMKSEPDVFGIDDLEQRSNQREPWDGIRNYQVRNMIRDEMSTGDLAFFYHSNCKPPGIVGIMKIVSDSYPDHTAFDPESKYYDAKGDPENPRWLMVDVEFVEKFPRLLSLEELKQVPALENMTLLRKGNRLSITEVSTDEWEIILSQV